MLVHRCDRCCVYKKEIQPCRAKFRGIWAILMHKMMFPSESCNSVSKGTFREFRPFSVIAEMFSSRPPWTAFTYPQGYAYPRLRTTGVESESTQNSFDCGRAFEICSEMFNLSCEGSKEADLRARNDTILLRGGHR